MYFGGAQLVELKEIDMICIHLSSKIEIILFQHESEAFIRENLDWELIT